MKKLLITILLAIWYSFVWIALSHAADVYYVTQSGAGDTDGSSLENAYSVAQFNTLQGGYAGSTFYFSGALTSTVDVNVYGLAGNYVTLDGYAAGDCAPIDATLATEQCTSSARFNNDGATLTNRRAFQLTNQDYVIIQDFRSDGGTFGFNGTGDGNCSSHIIVRRNEIHDIDGGGIDADWGNYYTIGGADGDGNEMYDIGTGTADGDIKFYFVDDFIVSYNHLYATKTSGTSADRGIDGVIMNGDCTNGLIEYNSIHSHKDRYGGEYGENAIDIKTETNNIIIRYNKLYDYYQEAAININSGAHYIYIYGNFIGESVFGIQVASKDEVPSLPATENIHIWSNILSGNMKAGLAFIAQSNPIGNVYFYNNTVSYNGFPYTGLNGTYHDASGNDYTGMYLYADGDGYFENNIFYYNQPTKSTYSHFYDASGTDRVAALEHNTYFFPSQTSTVHYDGSNRTIAYLKSNYSLEDDATEGEDSDPGLNNPDGTDEEYGTPDDDLSLDGNNINDGRDISGTIATVTVQGVSHGAGELDYDIGLSPNTDWSTTPPTVATASRDTYGWSRGAYVYTGAAADPVVTVTVADSWGGEENTTQAGFYINCDPDCAGETVAWVLSGSATDSTDYNCDNDSTQDITGGFQALRIRCTVVDDSDPEATEYIILTLSAGAGYTVGTPDSQQLEIRDNDGVVYDYGKNVMRGGVLR